MAKDNTVKVRRKIGVIDVVIIVAVLAIILTSVLRYTLDEGLFTQNDTACSISFRVSSVRYNTYDMLEENEKVFLSDFELLGTLSSLSITPAVFYAENDEGELISVHYPENTLVDISGEILCELSVSGGRYTAADGTHVCAGAELELHTDTVDMTVVVTKVSVMKGAEP